MDEIIELDSDTECSITEPSISIDLDSDNESSSIVGSILPSSKSSAEDVSQTSREFDQSYPVWIDDFNKKCLEIVGTKCSKKLDILMDKYLINMRREYEFCSRSSGRSFFVAKQMYKCLIFFYMYYQDVKDFFISSRWIENMVELLVIYCKLEIKSSMRVQRGKENDNMIATRIMNLMWITLENNRTHIIHVLLKMVRDKCFTKRQRDIFGPIFRKLLTTRQPCECTELEYIRLILAFKTWKRLLYLNEKKEISDMCTRLVKQPAGFAINYTRYRFLPPVPPSTLLHEHLITTMIDVPQTVQNYFVYIKNTQNKSIQSASQINKQISISTDFYMNFSTEEDLTEDFSESCLPLLNSIKEETDKIRPQKTVITDDTNIEKPAKVVEFIDLTDEEIKEPLWVETIAQLSEQYTKDLLESRLAEVNINDKESEEAKESCEKNTCELADSTVLSSQESNKQVATCSLENTHSSSSQDVSSTNDQQMECSPSTSIIHNVEEVNVSNVEQTTENQDNLKSVNESVSSEVLLPDSCCESESLKSPKPSENTVISKCHSDSTIKKSDPEISDKQTSENIISNNSETTSVEDKSYINEIVNDFSEEDATSSDNNHETSNKFDRKIDNEAEICQIDSDITKNKKESGDKLEEKEFVESLFNSEIVPRRTHSPKENEKPTSTQIKKSGITKNIKKELPKIDNIEKFIASLINKRKNQAENAADISKPNPDEHEKIEEIKKADILPDLKKPSEIKSNEKAKQLKVQIDRLKIQSESLEPIIVLKKDFNNQEIEITTNINNKVNDILTPKSTRASGANKKQKRVRFSDYDCEESKLNGVNETNHESRKSKKEECILKVYKNKAIIEHHEEIDPLREMLENEELENSSIKETTNISFVESNHEPKHKHHSKKSTSRQNKYNSDTIEEIKKQKDRGKSYELSLEVENLSESKETHRRSRKKKDRRRRSIETENHTEPQTSIHTRSRHKKEIKENCNDEVREKDILNKVSENNQITENDKNNYSYEIENSSANNNMKSRRHSDTSISDTSEECSSTHKNKSRSKKRDKKKHKEDNFDVSNIKIISQSTIQEDEIQSNNPQTENSILSKEDEDYNNVASFEEIREELCQTPIHIIDDNSIDERCMIQTENSQIGGYEIVSSEYIIESSHHEVPVQYEDTPRIETDFREFESRKNVEAQTPVVSNTIFEQFAEQTITKINSNVIPNEVKVVETNPVIRLNDFPSNSNNQFLNGTNLNYRETAAEPQVREKRKSFNYVTYRAAKVPKIESDYPESADERKSYAPKAYTKRSRTFSVPPGPLDNFLIDNYSFTATDLKTMDVRIRLTKLSTEEINKLLQGQNWETATSKTPLKAELWNALKESHRSIILERQDYLKSKSNDRGKARIDKREAGHKTGTSPDLFDSSSVQRGTFSPDMDLLFTNLSLNTNLEQHPTVNVIKDNTCSPLYCGYTPSPALAPILPPTIMSPVCPNVCVNVPQVSVEAPLPAEIPYWENICERDIITNEIPNLSQLIVNCNADCNIDVAVSSIDAQESLVVDCKNLDIDLMLKNCVESPCASPDHETHLPIKKRRVSSLNIVKDETRDIRDDISYPPTPMMSIAALENMKPHFPAINVRDIDEMKPPPVLKFKTPAQLKEVPPLNFPPHPVSVEQPLSINHTYNNPTINYHIGGVWGSATGPVAPPLSCPGPWAPPTCYYAPQPPPFKKKQPKSQARSKEDKNIKKTRRSKNNN